MAATMSIEEGNGGTPTWTAITTGRYCTSDVYNPGSSHPCVVPPTGQLYYSYWKSHRLAWTGIGTQISNIKWYGPGGDIGLLWGLGTEGDVKIGIKGSAPHGCPDGQYDQATGTTDTTGDSMDDSTNGHAYYKGAAGDVVSIDSYTSASPLLVDNNVYTNDSHSYHVVTQVVIDNDATQGDKSDKTFTFVYDEI